MHKFLMIAVVLLTPALGLAQPAEAPPEPKIVVVPYPGAEAAPAPTAATPPPAPATVVTPAADAPRTFEAVPPTPPLPPAEPVVQGPPGPAPVTSAMIDGHPREGAFLSGPGSLTFLLHHTLMDGFGVLTTQMLPRILDSYCLQGVAGCVSDSTRWTGQDARVAYLAGTLIGAGVGFGAVAWWQFTHWMSESTANFGMVNSLFGAMFLGGLTDVITHSAVAISWLSLLGGAAGGWITAIVGGGDLPFNKGLLITSGGLWAAIYTALILAVVASTGGAANLRGGLEALLITPAIGAGAMALATLKFNPSTTQIMRANLFGLGVGAGVLVLSALVLGAKFDSPVPYVLAGVGAIGAKTIVSLLWADAAENPPQQAWAPEEAHDDRYRSLW